MDTISYVFVFTKLAHSRDHIQEEQVYIHSFSCQHLKTMTKRRIKNHGPTGFNAGLGKALVKNRPHTQVNPNVAEPVSIFRKYGVYLKKL